MTREITKKQKTDRIAKFRSQKERIPTASENAPIEKAAFARSDLASLPEAPQEKGFPIVGIGASAGGLAAFEGFFEKEQRCYNINACQIKGSFAVVF